MCPKTVKCPLFNNNLLKRKESEETYKSLYCKTADRYKECRRFKVSNQFGKYPDFVMPNSTITDNEIIEKMKKKGLIES